MLSVEQLDWNYIDAITAGRLGRTMAVCPLCSASRRTPQRRNSKVLAITLIDPEFAVYFCNHCEAQGYCRPDTAASASRPIDLTERLRQRAQARQHAEEEKQDRTRQAIALWDQGRPFRGSPAEDYLHHTRGIADWLDTFPFLDQVFRYHPDCPFGAGESAPCLLALVRDIKTDDPVAVHRTALTAEPRPQRIDRKSLGPVGGGAIKISPNADGA